MSRMKIVLGVAILTATFATASNVRAEEPAPRAFAGWRDWFERAGEFFRGEPRVPTAVDERALKRYLKYQRSPSRSPVHMPIDYSYDHLVDQP